MGVFERVGDVLQTGGNRREADAENQDTEPEDAESQEGSHLSRCSPCETTYITRKLETCPECGVALETIPNERDLGMT
jgi:rRNA maturation endonuclease Nob1